MYNVFSLNQNLCAKKPCLNNGRWYMGYTEKKYVCVCPAGYHGENCEKGKRYIDKSRLSLIVRVNVVLNRTVVVDSD